VNRSASPSALAPPVVVTETWRAPIVVEDGDVAVIRVAESTVKLLAGPASPKVTSVAPVKPVPVITTLVPPVVGPEVGATPVMRGAAT
jgi:hypothetical protein